MAQGGQAFTDTRQQLAIERHGAVHIEDQIAQADRFALRKRKLLMHAEELRRLIGKVERAGYTLIPLNLHYKGGWIKLEIGLAKGKKQYDKRQDIKERDWQRQQQRLMRQKA